MAKLRVERHDDGVALLTLDDPERRNAMGAEMGAELIEACERFSSPDERPRVLVITGEGTAFCAGADLPTLFGDQDRDVKDTHAALGEYYQAFLSVRALPFPTVAAVNGPAVGAGLNLALACDLRIAGPSATFGATFATIGLHPGGGCTWFLVEALGASRALRTLLLGEALDARQAVSWGLADGPEEDVRAAALALAARIARVDAPLAGHIKRAVRLAVETGDLQAVLEYETWAQAASANSPRLQEWVARFR